MFAVPLMFFSVLAFTGEQSSFFADHEQSAQDETQRAESPNSGHLSGGDGYCLL